MNRIANKIDLKTVEKARKHLHQHPELSEQEEQTSKFIFDFLSEQAPKAHLTKLNCFGVLACFDSQKDGPSTLIRVDIDALPIQESNTFEHRSKFPGISHKCGHDGHTAIGLGLAMYLNAHSPKTGKVYIIFQPAEEVGRGALKILEQPEFKDLKFDFAYALHNLPGKEMGTIFWKDGVFTPNVFSWVFKFHGKTAHAAEPETGFNPSICIAKLLNKAEELSVNQPESDDFLIIVPVHVTVGEKAYGISAGYGELHLTLRSWDKEKLEKTSQEFHEYVAKVCKEENLSFEEEKIEAFESNLNDSEATSILSKALSSGQLKSEKMSKPNRWGEDFGYFTHQLKGCMFGLGSGVNSPALHNPDYDFPDEILEPGIEMFAQIVNEINGLE